MIQQCSRFVVPRIQIYRVPTGPSGTLVTARLIARLIRDGAKDFYVRQKAIEIFRASGARPKDKVGEVCALFNWVRKNVRYTRDIFQVELLHSARRMLELRAGDCDDATRLPAGQLHQRGHPLPAAGLLEGWANLPVGDRRRAQRRRAGSLTRKQRGGRAARARPPRRARV